MNESDWLNLFSGGTGAPPKGRISVVSPWSRSPFATYHSKEWFEEGVRFPYRSLAMEGDSWVAKAVVTAENKMSLECKTDTEFASAEWHACHNFKRTPKLSKGNLSGSIQIGERVITVTYDAASPSIVRYKYAGDMFALTDLFPRQDIANLVSMLGKVLARKMSYKRFFWEHRPVFTAINLSKCELNFSEVLCIAMVSVVQAHILWRPVSPG